MAKKRDRRVAPSSNRGKEQVDSSTKQDQLGDAASSDRRLIFIFVLFFIVSSAVSVLVYRTKYTQPAKRTDSYVSQRGLVKTDVNYQEILTVSTEVVTSMFWEAALVCLVAEKLLERGVPKGFAFSSCVHIVFSN